MTTIATSHPTTPAASARPDWVDDELFPFTSRFIPIDGHVVHYVDEGAGPVLLMIHGNPTWSFVYRHAIADLAHGFRCIAVDLPGFGLSTAPDGYDLRPGSHAEIVAAFVAALDLRDVTLVVQDWGGPIGLTAALRAPDRYARLVIANTWAWPVNGDLHFEAFSRMMGGPAGRALIRRTNLFVRAMIPAGHRRRTLSAAEMAHYRAAQPTADRRQATALLPQAILGERDFLAGLEAGLHALCTLPSLIVWGDADIAFRAKERTHWEALLPDHTTVILEGAGHFLPSDAPAEFAGAIRDWMRPAPGA